MLLSWAPRSRWIPGLQDAVAWTLAESQSRKEGAFSLYHAHRPWPLLHDVHLFAVFPASPFRDEAP